MKPSEEQIQSVLDAIGKALRDPRTKHVEIHQKAGIVRRPNYTTGYMEGNTTGASTITLKINGGGGVRDEDPNVSALRLTKDLRRRTR